MNKFLIYYQNKDKIIHQYHIVYVSGLFTTSKIIHQYKQQLSKHKKKIYYWLLNYTT
jgi:hypothetical protein